MSGIVMNVEWEDREEVVHNFTMTGRDLSHGWGLSHSSCYPMVIRNTYVSSIPVKQLIMISGNDGWVCRTLWASQSYSDVPWEHTVYKDLTSAFVYLEGVIDRVRENYE